MTGKQISKSGLFRIEGEQVLIDGSNGGRYEIHLRLSNGNAVSNEMKQVTSKELETMLEKGEIVVEFPKEKGKRRKAITKILKLTERVVSN